MASPPLLILFFLPIFITFSNITASVYRLESSESICKDNSNYSICELQRMKLKISQLESILEKSTESISTKVNYLEEKVKLIEGMSHKIESLQISLSNIKGGSEDAKERINTLEEEVRLLWSASRKNNFDIHILESNVRETRVRLKATISEVEKIGNIVTEQWIQIRQLDQALVMTEMRTAKTLRRGGLTRCKFLKFIKGVYGHHLPRLYEAAETRCFGKKSVKSSYMSQALHHFKNAMLAAKRYHHELQTFVKHEMEKNEFTAALANQEVVFVVASVLVIVPLLSAWVWLLSHFS